MQEIMSSEQLWVRFGQLDPFQQQSVVAYIESLLKSKLLEDKRNKKALLSLSVWTDEDIAGIEETRARIDAWRERRVEHETTALVHG